MVLVVIDTTDKARRTQLALQSLAIVGKRTKEEREREEEDAVEAQGPRSRCQVLTEKVQTLCFLQCLAVFEFVQAKSPQGRPAQIALDFLSAESSSCLLAKAIEPDWILWRLL